MDTTSDRIQDDVRNALADDPRIPYVDEIAVDTYGGAVTLRGTVGSFAERRGGAAAARPARGGRAAVADARRTRGVIDVYDDLRVRLLDRDRREDAEIRGAALQRLMWDPELVADYLDVQVKDGWLRLEGDVDHQFQ